MRESGLQMRLMGAAVVAVFVGAGAGACIVPERPSSRPAVASASETDIGATPFGGDKFVWPTGKTAGVSLTYDDALRSQLDIAVPALARHRLLGTFFLTEGARNAADEWKGVGLHGHELAAHTMLHPCDGAQSWVKKGNALQNYDPARMTAELKENIALLKSLGSARGPYTFAYPCGSTWIGESKESYVPLVKQLFSAARGAGTGTVDPGTETFESVSTVSGDKGGDDLISLVEDAEKRNGWVVFTFHGVGGDYLSASADAHEKLLAYLDSHRSTIWTGTFLALSSYIQTHRPPLATPVR